MKLYGLKNCDTCRKAMKALDAAGKSPQLIEVRSDDVTRSDIERWLAAYDWKTLLNTRSTTWRGLSDEDKADIDMAKALSLMDEHRALIKRPVIESGGKIYVGWKADVQSVLLG